MAVKQNNFEGGTDGANITAGASGGASGDAFSSISAGANATRVYSTAQAAHGTKSALLTVSSAGAVNNIQIVCNLTASATQAVLRGYFYFPTLPPVTTQVMVVGPSAGNYVGTVNVQSDGKMLVGDQTGGFYTSTAIISVNTWYRFELAVQRGTTTANGSIQYAAYVGDSTTPFDSTSSAARNTGTTATYSNAQFGRTGTTAAVTHSYYMDDVAWNDGATAFIGPALVANLPPTANAGVDQADVEPYATVTLTGTDADSDGTVNARAWAQTAGSPAVTLAGTGASRTFTAPATLAGTTLTFTYTATDNSGAATSDAMTVTVLPVTERAVIGGVEVPMQVRAT